MSQPVNPSPPVNSGDGKTYRQIFKSTALVGGAQVVTLVVSIARTKVLAVLLGTSGVGVAGLYSTGVSLVGVITGLGLGASGVRQIAESSNSGDAEKFARTVRTLRVTALLSSIVGMLIVIGFCRQLSWATFHSYEYAVGFVILAASTKLRTPPFPPVTA